VSGHDRVLFVDDEPAVLDGIRRRLRSGFAVQTALGADAGLAAIDTDAPFAVVVCDLRMPGTDGVAVLREVRRRAPDSTRVLLTGQADLDAAVGAVNEGAVFRFLWKPCPPGVLEGALRDGIEQHRLVTAERELLQLTLRGAVHALLETLALANPLAFARATRITRRVVALASTLDAQDAWQIEVAAMLAQLGTVTLPPVILDQLHRGGRLSPVEQQVVDRMPELSAQILAGIPRFDEVRRIVRYQHQRYDGRTGPAVNLAGAAIPLGTRILRAATDYDMLEAGGKDPVTALRVLRQREGTYDPDVLDALARLLAVQEDADDAERLSVTDLRAGMILAADLRTSNGVLLCGRGQVVTVALLERLTNWSAQLPSKILVERSPDPAIQV